MDNRINEIRKRIRALRISMLQAEAVMREQINQDQECSFMASEILKMRGVMSALVRERESLGDREPILVNSFFLPRRAPAAPLATRTTAKPRNGKRTQCSTAAPGTHWKTRLANDCYRL